MALTEQEVQEKLRRVNGGRPRIVSASYADGKMTLVLGGTAAEGTVISFDPRSLPWVAQAGEETLSQFRVMPDGFAVVLADGSDISLNAVWSHVLGIETAEAFRARIQSASTPKKAASSRANGAKGGRPRKKPADEFSEEKLRQHLPKPESEELGDVQA